MNASRISAALVVSVLLSGGTALAGPHGTGAQAPPVRMWSTLPPPHFSRMKPFVTPKRFVLPVYVPVSLPYWGGFGTNPYLMGGFGLSSTACQSTPQTLGELGAGGPYTGFAPVALGTPAFDSLESPSLAAGPFSAQAYCQPPPLGWSSFDFGF